MFTYIIYLFGENGNAFYLIVLNPKPQTREPYHNSCYNSVSVRELVRYEEKNAIFV